MNCWLSYILYITQLKLLLFITIIYGNISQSWRATFLNIASVQFISTKDRLSNKLMINYQLDNLNYNFIRKQNQGIPLCTGEVWLQIHVQIFCDRYVWLSSSGWIWLLHAVRHRLLPQTFTAVWHTRLGRKQKCGLRVRDAEARSPQAYGRDFAEVVCPVHAGVQHLRAIYCPGNDRHAIATLL